VALASITVKLPVLVTEGGGVEGETLGEIDDEGLAELDGESEGELDDEGVKSVKIIQDIAPSSRLVADVQVLVAVPAVVEVAVLKPKAPPSTSRSSVSPDHVSCPPVAPARPITAIIPPPAAIVVEPVVSGSVASMSVEPSLPAEEYAPSETL